jgi:hypothetical protein
LIGLALLAQMQGEALLWAFGQENIPAIMTCARVLTEIQINLDYILDVPEHREYRASLLVMEHFDRNLEMYRSVHAPMDRPGDPEKRQWLVLQFEKEREKFIERMATLPKGEDDLKRWKDRGAIWIRAQSAKMESFYALLYNAGSGFVHADGYAIVEVMSGKVSGLDPALPAICANFVGATVEALLHEFPELETPTVVRAWNTFALEAKKEDADG